MLPNKFLHSKRLCMYKDTACSACVGTTAHCLRQSFFTRYARACVVSLNYSTTGVQPEFARVSVSTNSVKRRKIPEGHTDFETKSSVLHLARRGAGQMMAEIPYFSTSSRTCSSYFFTCSSQYSTVRS